MKQTILSYYEEYKTYMDLNNDVLPQINPIQSDNNIINDFAHINSDEISDKNINLYYNSKIVNYSEHFQKTKFFHEFTHVLDASQLLNKYDEENINAILSTYSEYHASQIELAYNIGFRNIHSFHKINLDKTYVEDEFGKTKIKNDYLKPLADATIIIDKDSSVYYNLSAEEYYKKYKAFETNTMYYLGKQNFCSKFSLKPVPSITKSSYGIFYPYVKNIEILIKNKDIDNLLIAKKELSAAFLKIYPNSELKILI